MDPPHATWNLLSTEDAFGGFGCFIDYHTSVSHKIWDFERKCFINSHDLIFEETEFPKASDFDELLADHYNDSRKNQQVEQAEQAPGLYSKKLPFYHCPHSKYSLYIIKNSKKITIHSRLSML